MFHFTLVKHIFSSFFEHAVLVFLGAHIAIHKIFFLEQHDFAALENFPPASRHQLFHRFQVFIDRIFMQQKHQSFQPSIAESPRNKMESLELAWSMLIRRS